MHRKWSFQKFVTVRMEDSGIRKTNILKKTGWTRRELAGLLSGCAGNLDDVFIIQPTTTSHDVMTSNRIRGEFDSRAVCSIQKQERAVMRPFLSKTATSSWISRMLSIVTNYSFQHKQNRIQHYDPCKKRNRLLKTVSRVAQSVQCLTTGWTAGVRSPTEAEDFYSTLCAQPALGPTQPPIQWVPGALSPGIKRGRGVMLTTHPILVLRLRKSRSYTSS
jgi:hypothetical protein